MAPRVYECPSPDDCEFSSGGAAELLEHVNSEHPDEYQPPDWPDTEVGRQSKSSGGDDEDDTDEDGQ